MTLIIGIDPHKASHTAVAIGGDEQQSAEIRVRATSQQTQQLLAWAEPLGKKTWAVESAGGMGYLLSQQLVGAGEQVLDVTATLASHTGGPSSGSRSSGSSIGTQPAPFRTNCCIRSTADGVSGRCTQLRPDVHCWQSFT